MPGQSPASSRSSATDRIIVARRYYLDGASKSEIAAEMGLSRFQVARLLDSARRNGIVRIEIAEPANVDVELADRLADRFGLRGAVVVRPADPSDEARRSQLGEACADLLTRNLTAADVLGMSWGRTLHAMVSHLHRLPNCTVVQIVGSVPTLELNVNSMELLRRVAEAAGGPAYPLYVPLLVDSPQMAAALRTDPHVARTLAMFDRLTMAVVGIGAWTPEGSTVRAALPAGLAGELDAAGAVADVCSIVLDAAGHPLETGALPARVIAIGPEQLRAVPEVVALAGGAAKAPAILAVLRSGLLHRLITDEEAARVLLAA